MRLGQWVVAVAASFGMAGGAAAQEAPATTALVGATVVAIDGGKPIEDDSIAIIWRIPGAERLIHTPCAAEALYLTAGSATRIQKDALTKKPGDRTPRPLRPAVDGFAFAHRLRLPLRGPSAGQTHPTTASHAFRSLW